MKIAHIGMKKFLAMGVVAAMCSLAVAVPAFADEGAQAPEPASADEGISTYANTGDTGFYFNLSSYTTSATEYRAKQDASSTYVYAKSLTNPCQLFVNGTGNNNCTTNDRAYLNRTGEFQIYQQVWERGYRTANLAGWRSGYGTIASGVWSPDSWGSYTIINAGY